MTKDGPMLEENRDRLLAQEREEEISLYEELRTILKTLLRDPKDLPARARLEILNKRDHLLDAVGEDWLHGRLEHVSYWLSLLYRKNGQLEDSNKVFAEAFVDPLAKWEQNRKEVFESIIQGLRDNGPITEPPSALLEERIGDLAGLIEMDATVQGIFQCFIYTEADLSGEIDRCEDLLSEYQI